MVHLTPAPNVTGNPDNGRRLFTDSRLYPPSGCGTCHTLTGVASGVFPSAPNLTNVTLRPTLAKDAFATSPDNLRRWIFDPPSMKNGALMPKLPAITEQDAQDLAAFLYSQAYNPER